MSRPSESQRRKWQKKIGGRPAAGDGGGGGGRTVEISHRKSRKAQRFFQFSLDFLQSFITFVALIPPC